MSTYAGGIMPDFRRTVFVMGSYKVVATAKPTTRTGVLRIPLLARKVPYTTGSSPGVTIKLELQKGSPSPAQIEATIRYLRPDNRIEEVAQSTWNPIKFPVTLVSRNPWLVLSGEHSFLLELVADGKWTDRNTMVRLTAISTDMIAFGLIVAFFGGLVAYVLNKIG